MDIFYEVYDYAKSQDWRVLLSLANGCFVFVVATMQLISYLRKKSPSVIARNEFYNRLFSFVKDRNNWAEYDGKTIVKEIPLLPQEKQQAQPPSKIFINHYNREITLNGYNIKNQITKRQFLAIMRESHKIARFLKEKENLKKTVEFIARLPANSNSINII